MIKLKTLLCEGDEVIEKFISLLPKYGLEFHSWDDGDKSVAFHWRGSTYPTITDKDRIVKVALDRTDLFVRRPGEVWMGDPSRPLLHGYVIQAIVTDPEHRKSGKASEMLKRVLKAADEAGLLLKLEAAPMTDFIKKGKPKMSRDQLVKWYSKLGFKKHPEASLMTREPPKISEEKEAFRKEKERKIFFLINDKNARKIEIRLYVKDYITPNPVYQDDPEWKHLMGQIVLLRTFPEDDFEIMIPKPGYLFVDTVVTNIQYEGYGYMLYREGLRYAMNHGYKGLVSIKIHRTDSADQVWKKLKTFEDNYYNYVNIEDLGTRIKEEQTLDEAKKFNMNNAEDAAEFMIRQTWQFMTNPEDRYSDYQVSLWMDNEEKLQHQKEELSNKLFPNDPYPMDTFSKIIFKKLDQLEKKRNERVAKKINPLDPLFHLKKLVCGKTYEGAKQALINVSMGAWGYRGGKITEDEAENAFNRMYKNAMGETVYDENRVKEYGRLSDMRVLSIEGDPRDSIEGYKQYMINTFILYNLGYIGDRFPKKVRVYRGVHSPLAKIRPGDYVSFDRDYASSYTRGKFGSVVSDVLNSKDLYVHRPEPDNSELVYWPEGHQIQKYQGHIPTFREFWTEINEL